MQFRVLGPVEVSTTSGHTVELGSERRRTILAALLAARGRVVSTGRLVDAVWHPDPPVSALNSLRSHISRLRGELRAADARGGRAVVSGPDGYRVDPEVADWDAVRFEQLVAHARDTRDVDPAETVTLLEQAERLWRGPAFGELADNEIVRPEAVRLERLRADAADDRVDALLALGRHREVVAELEARTAADPLDETAHSRLMLALYRSGRQADAMAVYRALQRRLRDELGVDPSPAARAVYTSVLRQEADPAAPAVVGRRAPSPPERGAAASVDHPPGPPNGRQLIGRDEDVALVAGLVNSSTVVTLTGPGGVGKTRLAERVAAEVAERFDDGVVTGWLAPVREPGSVGMALVGAFEVPQQGGRSAEETVVAAVGRRRVLLVLDNCEHVLAPVCQLVATLLARCPHLAVLATSREPLRLPGERVWRVAPLPVPPAGAGAAEVLAAPAGALFRDRAAAAEPGFVLTGASAPAVAAVCRRLDGLPLAIELAAARVRAMDPDDLRARLSDRFAVLTGGPAYEAGRHRTLQAVVSWSYELLTEHQARLFDRLSVFAGPFSLGAAEHVCAGEPVAAGQVPGELAELVDKSMVAVDRSGEAVRYRLLDTLRDYGAARLAEAGATEVLRRRHADYHVALAEQWGPRVRGPDQAVACADIDAVMDDLRVAHEWLVAAEDVDGALRLAVALGDYLEVGLREEITTWLERAVHLTGAPEHPAYPLALAAAAYGAALRSDFARSRERAEAVLADSEAAAPARLWALVAVRVTGMLTGAFDEVVALDGAVDEVIDALDAPARDVNYYRVSAGVQGLLVRLYGGDVDGALAVAARLDRAAEASGNPYMRALALSCHGEALMVSDPAGAQQRLEAAVELARGAGSHLPEGAALVTLASLCTRRGDTNRALSLFREAVRLWRRFTGDRQQLTTLRNLVELLARVGADEAAATLHGAVTGGDAPAFGEEAERLDAAWTDLVARVDADRAHTRAAEGRRMSVGEAADYALGVLDDLLDR